MKRLLTKIKNAIRAAYVKFKTWVVSLLVMLGIIVGGAALAQPRDFAWDNPTQNVDGTAYDAASEQKESRVYCGVDPAAFVPETPGQPQTLTPATVAPGASTAATADFMPGDYSCFATVVSKYGYESDPSNVVAFTITPTVAPAAPTNFTVSE